MIAYPVSRYLVHFGAEEKVATVDDLEVVVHPLSTKVDEPIEDRAALLEAAREEGRREASAAAQARLEMKLEELKRDYEQRVSAERSAWVEEESNRLGLGLTQALAQLEELLANALDAVLRPFLIESLRRQMIDELANNVAILLASDPPAIEISGSADLLAALREKLSSESAVIDYKPNESIDVRITAHHTVIESQLRAWIDRFEHPKEPD